MTEQHDEALVERVADAIHPCTDGLSYAATLEIVRDAAYPPAPPKTRLQVARELLAAAYRSESMSDAARAGSYDNDADMRAVLAALALPAMED